MERSVYLALGAREGDPLRQIMGGLADLDRSGLGIVEVSGLWETEPVGIPSGPPVLNAAAHARTLLSPRRILEACIAAEGAAGRRRTDPEWRSLDVDILLVDDLVLHEPDLVIPHPRFHVRRFNLAPLAQIAPHLSHPLIGMTIRDLLDRCADPAWVRLRAEASWGALVERGGSIR